MHQNETYGSAECLNPILEKQFHTFSDIFGYAYVVLSNTKKDLKEDILLQLLSQVLIHLSCQKSFWNFFFSHFQVH